MSGKRYCRRSPDVLSERIRAKTGTVWPHRRRMKSRALSLISYAQNFEDVMLGRVFAGRKTGFYVDVGAADPVNLSVTKWFYDLGWSGLNIEPNRPLFERLATD